MRIGMSWLDVKLGLRMLLKYPGLTIAGGLALAIAIGIGAAGTTSPASSCGRRCRFPTATASSRSKCATRRIRTNGGCCTTSSAGGATSARSRTSAPIARSNGTSRVANAPAGAGDARRDRPRRRSASPACRRFWAGHCSRRRTARRSRRRRARLRACGSGRSAGAPTRSARQYNWARTRATVVGVMPEGFAFPMNHQMWVPLQLRHQGTRRSRGGAIRVFGRLAPGRDAAQATTELAALEERAAAASPRPTSICGRACMRMAAIARRHVVVRVRLTHLPILLVLTSRARTSGHWSTRAPRRARRKLPCVPRSAPAARRIVAQLFVEALVLASAAAVVGLSAANWR